MPERTRKANARRKHENQASGGVSGGLQFSGPQIAAGLFCFPDQLAPKPLRITRNVLSRMESSTRHPALRI